MSENNFDNLTEPKLTIHFPNIETAKAFKAWLCHSEARMAEWVEEHGEGDAVVPDFDYWSEGNVIGLGGYKG